MKGNNYTFTIDDLSNPKITIEGKTLHIRQLRFIWRAPDSFQRYKGENSIMVEGYFEGNMELRYFKIDNLLHMCFELTKESPMGD